MLQSTRSAPTRSGGYLLAGFPDCTTLYRGAYETDSVYAVGRNSEFERLFKRSQLTEATQYAIEVKQQIESLPCVAVCQEAVVALLAS